MAEENTNVEATTEDGGTKLLAGKYETQEELEKGYLELLAERNAEKQAEQAEADKDSLETARDMLSTYGEEALSPEQAALIKKYGAEEKKTEDESKAKAEDTSKKDAEGSDKNFGTKPEHKGLPEGTDFATYDFLVEKGMTHDDVRGYMAKMSDGSFSDAEAKAIAEKIGVPEAVVKGYAQPRMAPKGGAEAPLYSNEQVSELVTVAGGAKEYEALQEWARASLDADTTESFNAAIDSGNIKIAKNAIRGLKAMRDANTGNEPSRRIDGGASSGIQPFENQQELAKAQSDPRYETSARYREEVMQRIAVSKNL